MVEVELVHTRAAFTLPNIALAEFFRFNLLTANILTVPVIYLLNFVIFFVEIHKIREKFIEYHSKCRSLCVSNKGR